MFRALRPARRPAGPPPRPRPNKPRRKAGDIDDLKRQLDDMQQEVDG